MLASMDEKPRGREICTSSIHKYFRFSERELSPLQLSILIICKARSTKLLQELSGQLLSKRGFSDNGSRSG